MLTALLLFACAGVAPSTPTDAPTVASVEAPAEQAPPGVLDAIADFPIPAYPQGGVVSMETFDYRAANGTPNPPTPQDALVVDLVQRLRLDVGGVAPADTELTSELLTAAIDVYLQKEWRDIAGYRPLTHWTYIRSLSDAQQGELAEEAVAWAHEHGVWAPPAQ